MSGHQNLIVDNPFGAIRIHRGPVNSVEVIGTLLQLRFSPAAHLIRSMRHSRETRSEYEVLISQARRSFSLGDFGRMDLDITIPESSDVHVQSDASSVTVDGIQGHTFIRTNAGTIDMKNASLASQSLHTNAGTTHMKNVRMEGNARMETNAGAISFSAINPGGDYSE